MCACSSGESYSEGGTADPGGLGGSSGSGGSPSIGAGAKTSSGKPPPGRISDICPELDTNGGEVVISSGGSTTTGTAGAGASSGLGSAGDGMAGAPSPDGVGQGGVASSAVGGKDGRVVVPCPSEPPVSEQGQACDGPGVCPYVDGSTCSCQACPEGWCWSCDVAELPFGCPRVPPKDKESCPWTGVVCDYGDCDRWDNTLAGCCLGEWRVVVNTCARRP